MLLYFWRETMITIKDVEHVAKLARLEAIQAQTEYDEKYGEKDGNN